MINFDQTDIESVEGDPVHDIVQQEAYMKRKGTFLTRLWECAGTTDPTSYKHIFSRGIHLQKVQRFYPEIMTFSVEEDFSRLLDWVKGQKRFQKLLARFTNLILRMRERDSQPEINADDCIFLKQ